MSTRQFGQPIKRNEDPRLLTGRALFTDDVQLAGMLHVAFLRSDLAHARIRSVELGGARERRGVVAVYTADDLGEFWQPGPLLVPPPPVEQLEFHQRTQVPLAKEKIRHAGEAVAMVVAESRYLAEDALEDLFIDYEPLQAVVDLEAALTSGAPLVHDDLGHNVNARVTQTKGDWTRAEAEADLIIRRRFHYDRGTAAAMENRGIVASWDDKSQHLTVWDTTQAPIAIRNGLAAMLGFRNTRCG